MTNNYYLLSLKKAFSPVTLLVGLLLMSVIADVNADPNNPPTDLVSAAVEHNVIRRALSDQTTLNNLAYTLDQSYDFALQPQPAQALPDLSDSPILQTAAAAHAETCLFEHSTSPYGENLFAITGNGWTIERAINSWSYEAQHYNYDDTSCTPGEMCGHYTQIVADDISEVGCAIQQCEQMSSEGNVILAGRSGLLMVCYYDKISNTPGQPTYAAVTDQGLSLAFTMKVILQGAYQAADSLMLPTANNALPASEPYSELGHSVSATEALNTDLLQNTGSDAIVDWVLVELRSATQPAEVLATKAFLLQRDGNVINSAGGSTTLAFAGHAPGSYHLAIKHRNHLGVMTQQALALSSAPTTVDFSALSTPVWGQHARFESAGQAFLWAGDVNHDGRIIAGGVANDASGVLETLLLDPANAVAAINFITQRYHGADTNMDGNVIFAGINNDTNLVRANVLLHPENTLTIGNFIVSQQIP